MGAMLIVLPKGIREIRIKDKTYKNILYEKNTLIENQGKTENEKEKICPVTFTQKAKIGM